MALLLSKNTKKLSRRRRVFVIVRQHSVNENDSKQHRKAAHDRGYASYSRRVDDICEGGWHEEEPVADRQRVERFFDMLFGTRRAVHGVHNGRNQQTIVVKAVEVNSVLCLFKYNVVTETYSRGDTSSRKQEVRRKYTPEDIG